jgi:outer membrane protein assembly factor BamB
MRLRRNLSLLAAIVVFVIPGAVCAGDWPMWRYDANRSGASPHELPAKLHLQWVREYRPMMPAWPDQDKMQFDIVREPVVVGQTMYFNSSRYDAMRAIDTRTGADKWTFFVDGPIRFAPVAWDGKLYFTSDDGYLYCLQAESGKLLWKFRGGPSDRKILGNERLISTWPARGAPVITDGKVYFAASIWPFMGIFIHALDARTGEPVWTNDADGSVYMKQPHNADSFASVAPQGPLVTIGNRLLIPGGRSVPASFDRRTGKMTRFQLAENGKRGGGSEVAAMNNIFFNGGAIFETASERYLGDYGKHVVLTPTHAFAWNKDVCKVFDLENSKELEAETIDAKGKKTKVKRWIMPEVASTKIVGVDTMMKAGDRLYFGGKNQVTVLDWNAEAKELKPSWNVKVKGQVVRLVAADDRLFVVTREGGLHCFAEPSIKPIIHAAPKDEGPKLPAAVKARAEQVLAAAKTRSGYAIVWGVGDGQLVEALARQSDLHVIVVEPSAEKVQAFRERWTKPGLYGVRIAILPGDSQTVQLPPYLATVSVCENGNGMHTHFLATAYQSLRPFGGTLCIFDSPSAQKLLATLPDQKRPQARLLRTGDLTAVVRDGPLPGSANWTHENADAANTRVSRDVLVKAPMGVLWFGGPSHDGILPRHGHGPQPQVVDGRMIIEGVDLMRAIDIYTGKLLWETKLPGVGFFYNNLAHQPGANASGSNFISTSDGIYVAYQNKCVRLDPATGKKIGEFALPKLPGMKESPRWGYINVAGDYLIGGADPLFNAKSIPPPPKAGDKSGDDPDPNEKKEEPKADPKKESTITKLFKTLKGYSDNMSASRHLVVMDRKTGEVLWTVSAKNSFRHNATCVGGGRLYTIDRLSGEQLARVKDNINPPAGPRLIAFDLKTGKEIWSTSSPLVIKKDKDKDKKEKEEDGIFGTWLSYSEKHDVLIEAGRVARDSLFDEPKGMRAYRASNGKELWFQKTYTGPAMILGDTILQDQGGCDLLTGALKMRTDPITLEQVPWKWIRTYGCNTPAASEHLLTFRSGAAGYFDLCNDGGTGNFGGFRSSCSNNLIVAGGVLTAPEYTRTCTCAYQNQSSIAMIHMPEAEMWTYFGTKDLKGNIKRLGVNFGAAGDRKAEDGTLWLEYPSVAGVSPAVQVTTKPGTAEFFRRHSSTVSGPYSWVTSSGLKNASEVAVALGTDRPRTYTVKLYFAEPDNLPAGKRLFHVDIAGKRVLSDFDIVKEAGGPGRTLVKEFTGVSAKSNFVIRLTPAEGASVRVTVLCGLELIAEDKK